MKNSAGIRLGGASVVMTLGGIREGPPGGRESIELRSIELHSLELCSSSECSSSEHLNSSSKHHCSSSDHHSSSSDHHKSSVEHHSSSSEQLSSSSEHLSSSIEVVLVNVTQFGSPVRICLRGIASNCNNLSLTALN